MKVDLSGKTAVVTGGSGVLCSAMARALARSGAKVAVLGRDPAKARAVADSIAAEGGTAMPVSCDVRDRAALEAAAREIEARLGPCDILVNGAGGNHPKGNTAKEGFEPGDLEAAGLPTFFDIGAEGFDSVFGLNLMGTVVATQVFAKGMIGREGCAVVNVSSMSAARPMTKVPLYSAAKAAIDNFTRWLAVHFAEAGIRVNAIAPGFFLTEQNRGLLMDAEGGLTERSRKIIAHTPMRRFGEPEDLVGALLWLCDASSSGFVTGTVIAVDGGFSAYAGV
jgi:NAD(P)-dependent dehydrogenase (short-subunit alcohol dehydrogenase family)